jgi:acetyltransferase-like isoleucine patch superfamily enzyme
MKKVVAQVLQTYYAVFLRFFWYAGYFLLPFPFVRRALLMLYANKVGRTISYQPMMRIFPEIKLLRTGKVIIGDNANLQDVYINAVGDVWIEDDVFFGHKVLLLSGRHDITCLGLARQLTISSAPIRVKEGAWIASGAIILGGVTVGRHAVVGAGAVVTKDVPDFAVVAGNPAKIIKYVEPHAEQKQKI